MGTRGGLVELNVGMGLLKSEMVLKELEGERERGDLGISREGLAASGLVGTCCQRSVVAQRQAAKRQQETHRGLHTMGLRAAKDAAIGSSCVATS